MVLGLGQSWSSLCWRCSFFQRSNSGIHGHVSEHGGLSRPSFFVSRWAFPNVKEHVQVRRWHAWINSFWPCFFKPVIFWSTKMKRAPVTGTKDDYMLMRVAWWFYCPFLKEQSQGNASPSLHHYVSVDQVTQFCRSWGGSDVLEFPSWAAHFPISPKWIQCLCLGFQHDWSHTGGKSTRDSRVLELKVHVRILNEVPDELGRGGGLLLHCCVLSWDLRSVETKFWVLFPMSPCRSYRPGPWKGAGDAAGPCSWFSGLGPHSGIQLGV